MASTAGKLAEAAACRCSGKHPLERRPTPAEWTHDAVAELDTQNLPRRTVNSDNRGDGFADQLLIGRVAERKMEP